MNRTVTRTINYVDTTNGQTVSSQVVQTANFTRNAIVDVVTGQLVSYTIDGTHVVAGDAAWQSSNNNVSQVVSPGLSSRGYDAPDQAALNALTVHFGDPSTSTTVRYGHHEIVVNSQHPVTDGALIDPNDPSGPTWSLTPYVKQYGGRFATLTKMVLQFNNKFCKPFTLPVI